MRDELRLGLGILNDDEPKLAKTKIKFSANSISISNLSKCSTTDVATHDFSRFWSKRVSGNDDWLGVEWDSWLFVVDENSPTLESTGVKVLIMTALRSELGLE